LTIVHLPILDPTVSAPVAVRRPTETRRREGGRRDPFGDPSPEARPHDPAYCGVAGFDSELEAPPEDVEARGFDLALVVDHGPYVEGSGLLPRSHSELHPPTA